MKRILYQELMIGIVESSDNNDDDDDDEPWRVAMPADYNAQFVDTVGYIISEIRAVVTESVQEAPAGKKTALEIAMKRNWENTFSALGEQNQMEFIA